MTDKGPSQEAIEVVENAIIDCGNSHFTWEQAAADILAYHAHLKRKGIKVEAIEMTDDIKPDPHDPVYSRTALADAQGEKK